MIEIHGRADIGILREHEAGEAVAHLVKTFRISERRACSVIGTDRSTIRCRSRRPDDVELRERLRALAGERRRLSLRPPSALLRQLHPRTPAAAG